AGCDLRVEDAPHLRVKAPAHERDVLTTRVHDRAHAGIGEDLRKRPAVEIIRQRVDQLDALAHRADVWDRQLNQAQQRAVAALAHELGVHREGLSRAGPRRDLAQGTAVGLAAHPCLAVAPTVAGGGTPGRRHKTPFSRSPASRETSLAWARIQRTGVE